MNAPYDIDYFLDEVVTLPSLPETVVRVAQMVENPECRLKDVAGAISADPALAIKTLRLVNSAYYGLGQQVTTLEHAVVLLGIKVIKNLALTATVFETFKSGTSVFLRHSVACGTAMRAITENTLTPASKHITADEAFVYGLLHDIGKVIVEEFLPQEAAKIPALMQARRITWYQAEQALLGVDHAQVGARLAAKWKLAPLLIHAIEGHHDLVRCPDDASRVLAATVAVADYLCGACGLHSCLEARYQYTDDIWEVAGIRSVMVPPLVQGFLDHYPLVDELVGLAA